MNRNGWKLSYCSSRIGLEWNIGLHDNWSDLIDYRLRWRIAPVLADFGFGFGWHFLQLPVVHVKAPTRTSWVLQLRDALGRPAAVISQGRQLSSMYPALIIYIMER